MHNIHDVKTLIDKAATVCGSQSNLARELGIPPQHLSNMKNGIRKAQPSDIAAIGGIAGYDAAEMLARATVEDTEGTKKGAVLAKYLGKALLATGAAIATGGANAKMVGELIRCIERLNPKRHIDRYTLSELAA